MGASNADYERQFKEIVAKAKAAYGTGAYDDSTLEFLIPGLRESEDERIRKLLVWQVYRNIEDETNDLAQSVYDGIKGHDPDIEESIEDWKKCLAYLEKQKPMYNLEIPAGDVAPAEEDGPFDEDGFLEDELSAFLQNYDKEYDDDAAVSDVAKHFYEIGKKQKEQEHICDSTQFEEGFKTGRESGLRDGQKYVLDNAESYGLCKPAEWSEEDEKLRRNLMSLLANMRGDRITEETYQKYYPWLKSLRPSWKPSEEQMKALQNAVALTACDKELVRLYNHLKKLV